MLSEGGGGSAAPTRSRHLAQCNRSAQFGASTKELFHFKPRFRRDIDLAMAVYPGAKVDLLEGGVRLWPSPPAVAQRSGEGRGLLSPDSPDGLALPTPCADFTCRISALRWAGRPNPGGRNG